MDNRFRARQVLFLGLRKLASRFGVSILSLSTIVLVLARTLSKNHVTSIQSSSTDLLRITSPGGISVLAIPLIAIALILISAFFLVLIVGFYDTFDIPTNILDIKLYGVKTIKIAGIQLLYVLLLVLLGVPLLLIEMDPMVYLTLLVPTLVFVLFIKIILWQMMVLVGIENKTLQSSLIQSLFIFRINKVPFIGLVAGVIAAFLLITVPYAILKITMPLINEGFIIIMLRLIFTLYLFAVLVGVYEQVQYPPTGS